MTLPMKRDKPIKAIIYLQYQESDGSIREDRVDLNEASVADNVANGNLGIKSGWTVYGLGAITDSITKPANSGDFKKTSSEILESTMSAVYLDMVNAYAQWATCVRERRGENECSAAYRRYSDIRALVSSGNVTRSLLKGES